MDWILFQCRWPSSSWGYWRAGSGSPAMHCVSLAQLEVFLRKWICERSCSWEGYKSWYLSCASHWQGRIASWVQVFFPRLFQWCNGILVLKSSQLMWVWYMRESGCALSTGWQKCLACYGTLWFAVCNRCSKLSEFKCNNVHNAPNPTFELHWEGW